VKSIVNFSGSVNVLRSQISSIAMTMVVDKGVLKEALRELIHEEPEVLRKLVKDVLAEESDVALQKANDSFVDDDEFDQLTQKNFHRFEATFRALA
jgi:hypothetical protein